MMILPMPMLSGGGAPMRPRWPRVAVLVAAYALGWIILLVARDEALPFRENPTAWKLAWILWVAIASVAVIAAVLAAIVWVFDDRPDRGGAA